METLNLIDSIKDRLSDGDYLNIMNALKRDYDALNRPRQPTRPPRPTPPHGRVPFATYPPVPSQMTRPPAFYANPCFIDKDVSTRRGRHWIVGRSGHNGSSYTITWRDGTTTTRDLKSLNRLIINHARRMTRDPEFREFVEQL